MSKLSTRLRTPNGMNLSKSMSNPNSRANKVLAYLRTERQATKVEILRDVFGRRIGDGRNGTVTRGWGAYLFVLLQTHGYIRRVRTGNTIRYEVV